MISNWTVTGRPPTPCVLAYLIACSGQDLNRLNDEEDVEEIRLDHAGMKGCVLFLKNNADDVIANVTFPLDLRRIRASERE